jgi:hypothetical protein
MKLILHYWKCRLMRNEMTSHELISINLNCKYQVQNVFRIFIPFQSALNSRLT